MMWRTRPAGVLLVLLAWASIGSRFAAQPAHPTPAACTEALSHARAGQDDAAVAAADACEQALGASPAPAIRADVEYVRGVVASHRGLVQETLRHHQRELELATAAGAKAAMARAYDRL